MCVDTMSITRSLPLLAALALLPGLAACSAADARDGDDMDSDLINGKPVAADAFGATLLLVRSTCTAVKVGPRHILTAGHCVRDAAGNVKPEFTPRAPLRLKTRAEPDPLGTAYTVEKTVLHPRLLEVCSTLGCAGPAANDRRDAPDVAVIIASREIRDIPSTPVDLDPVSVGESVTILGYGCQSGANGAFDADGVLRAAKTKVLDAKAIVHEGSPVRSDETEVVANMRGDYVFTPGPGMNDAAAGLCPGDSGGPVYRGSTTRASVVGVNASYTFHSKDAVGLPVTNWHTRLDAGARHEMKGWLEGLGVETTHGATRQ